MQKQAEPQQQGAPPGQGGQRARGDFWKQAVMEWTGLKIIDFEQQACDFSPDELRKRKDFYLSFVRSAVAALEKKGLANPGSREGVLAAWSEISELVWAKFKPVRILPTLSEGMDAKDPRLDCDTGAFLVADILAQLGVKSQIVGVDQHTLILIKTGGEPVYLEPKRNYGARPPGKAGEGEYYYTSKEQVEKACGKIYYELDFGANQPYLYNSRGNKHYARGEYRSAVKDYATAIRMGLRDPDTYYNLGLAYFEMGKYREAAESFERSKELNPDPRAQEHLDEARKAASRKKALDKAGGAGRDR